MIEHRPDPLGFLGMEDSFDLDHAVLRVAAADATALHVTQGMRILAVALYECVLVGQLFELRGRHEPRILEQQDLSFGRRDAVRAPCDLIDLHNMPSRCHVRRATIGPGHLVGRNHAEIDPADVTTPFPLGIPQLFVRDLAAIDVGTINAFALHITSTN